ncbi:pyridoxal phosphate biosynthetic protein [Altererythrobacter aurantiacus]|uniref:Pyridoxal phosphate biosynthetic protein n=1 Tax=Parapontixanthobacter aurantiacus TaxID=1463599 RepID=A0A844Z8F0_9SPHN|nr:pyridoxal phosphate biosynthetic protein [Parapontixanthobacter aurantiacus]
MADPLTLKQKVLFFAAALPFLISLGVAGYAINSGVLLGFGIAWPILQVFGYYSTLKMAKGDVAHPLFTTQIALHYIVLVLFVAIMSRVV